MEKRYLCIDLKSFYASVECIERNLNPMTTNLVVADLSRTEKTICLAVTPGLKKYGIPGRARLFEVVQKVKEINSKRQNSAPDNKLQGKSFDSTELEKNPFLEVDYIVAPPRMAHYIEHSTRIYDVYLKYVAPEDIHVYSIDEVFMDITAYLKTYKTTAYDLAKRIIKDVFHTTGITATAGIGTNLYLAKVAMDIMAKKIPADSDGVRIAELDEMTYRRQLWNHRPLTDFWRVGRRYSKKLEERGIHTMGDIARASLSKHSEDSLYKLFGVNAELLIDHAWGWEPCTMEDIKNYKPDNKSIGSGQVLHCPYEFDKARLVLREMSEALALDLVEKKLVTDQIVLTVGYDIENLDNMEYKGEITTDYYGRKVPKHAHGTANLKKYTSSASAMTDAVLNLFDEIVDKNLFIRRINLSANHIISENNVAEVQKFEQLDLFTDYEISEQEEIDAQKERSIQNAMVDIKNRFGRNAVIKGSDLQEGATAIDRNNQIGGHRA